MLVDSLGKTLAISDVRGKLGRNGGHPQQFQVLLRLQLLAREKRKGFSHLPWGNIVEGRPGDCASWYMRVAQLLRRKYGKRGGGDLARLRQSALWWSACLVKTFFLQIEPDPLCGLQRQFGCRRCKPSGRNCNGRSRCRCVPKKLQDVLDCQYLSLAHEDLQQKGGKLYRCEDSAVCCFLLAFLQKVHLPPPQGREGGGQDIPQEA